MNSIKGIVFLLLVVLGSDAFGQNYFYNFPKNFQFYERDSTGFGKVDISGSVTNANYESIKLIVLQNGVRYYDKNISLKDSKSFSWKTELLAGLFEYDFEIKVFTKTDSSSIVKAGKILCGDTYLIYGQSNAVAGCCFQDIRNQVDHTFIRNFIYDHFDPNSSNNGWHNLNVEFNWPGVVGVYLAKSIIDNHKIPVQVINGAVGGESLGKLAFRDSLNPENPENYYGRFLKRIKGSHTIRPKGLIFCQGEWESDTGEPEALKSYRSNFLALMKNLESDSVFVEKRYLIQTNILATAYIKEVPSQLREIQRKLKEDFPEMRMYAAFDKEVGGDGLHFARKGYEAIAKDIYLGIDNDFYQKAFKGSVTGPLIQKAVHDKVNKRIRLVFDAGQELEVQNVKDYGGYLRRFKDYVYNQKGEIFIDSASALHNEVTLYYSGGFQEAITYLPSVFTDNFSLNYNGPLIKNKNGLPALSFDKFKVCTELAPPVVHSLDLVNRGVILNLSEKKDCQNCKFMLYGKVDADKDYAFLRSYDYNADSLFVDLTWSKEVRDVSLRIKVESDACASGFLDLRFNKCPIEEIRESLPFLSKKVKNSESLRVYDQGNGVYILEPSNFAKPLNGVYSQEPDPFLSKIGRCVNN